MLRKPIKTLKVSSIVKTCLTPVIFAILFFSLAPTRIYAQFYYPQAYPYGNNYVYPDNYSQFNTNSFNGQANPYASNLTAITQPATNVSDGNAELNALILNPTLDPNTVTWFEYGTSTNLGKATTIVPVGAIPSVRHQNSMSGLLPGTTYYFSSVVQNSYGKNIGAILRFTTSGTQRPVIVNTTVIRSTDEVSPPVSAPATPTPADSNTGTSLGANVFDSGSIFPLNIFGWLILLILILLLVLAGRRAFGNRATIKNNAGH